MGRVGVLGVEVGGWGAGGGGGAVACKDREDDGAIKMCVSNDTEFVSLFPAVINIVKLKRKRKKRSR